MKAILRSHFGRWASAVLLLMAANSAGAQLYLDEPERRLFYGGLVAGINISTINNIDYPRYKALGLNAGGVVYAKFSRHVAGSMEILFSRKGDVNASATTSGQPGVLITSISTRLYYAEVPVMINYFDKKVGMLGAGLSYGRLTGSSEALDTYPAKTYPLSAYPYNRSDVEALIGGGFRIWQGLYLCIRFQYSLSQIRDKVPQVLSAADQYNNLWVVRIMYLF